MAEAAGVALGVLGLAGLYGLVIEACGQVYVARTMDRDLEVLATRYDIRWTRLLQWGDAVAMLSDNERDQDPRLHDATSQPLVARTLECIRLLLTDADLIGGKYGLKCMNPNDGAFDPSLHCCDDSTGLLSRYRIRTFRKAYKKRRQMPVVTTMKWVAHGADSFRLLLNDLDSLIQDLYTLVPVTPAFQRLMAKEDVENLPEDLKALKLVEEALVGDAKSDTPNAKDTAWLEAVSIKVEASEQASLHREEVKDWLNDISRPDEEILTAEEYEQKMKRRRESHDAVQRRRRDNVNDRIQELWRLVPKERVDEVVLEEKCKHYFRLPGQSDDSRTKIPIRSQSTVEVVSAIAPFLDVDWSKYPNKGQILKSSVRWVVELSEILQRKFNEEDQLRQMIHNLGGDAPFERTADDQRLRIHISQSLQALHYRNTDERAGL